MAMPAAPVVTSEKATRAPATAKPMIEIDDVDFYYGKSQALHDVTLNIAEREVLDRNVPPPKARLQDIPQRSQLHLIFRGQRKGAVDFVELDRGSRALEIVALGDLFPGLVDCVVHLLQIDRGGHVKR